MSFKIVSVGWDCARFVEWTLESIEGQTNQDWEVWITIDPSDDGTAEKVVDWCRGRDSRWNYTINTERLFAVRNQVEAIENLNPDDDDIIVWLDVDGDKFAHPNVLNHLEDYYADDTLLTYGSYLPVPPNKGWQQALPFPEDTIRKAGYRKHALTLGCCFNHLRTMKGIVYRNIPQDHFRWSKKPDVWYDGGTDYIFMMAGLELAGRRHRFIEEILCHYNNANPNADYLTRGTESSACTLDYLQRPKLKEIVRV